ncbi:MAG: hypothetical protein LKJ25_08695 [Clostridia bacterium]|jgi:hypothetical protein|nr:hypothetical protein [Clostridia bacterium]
MKSKEENYVDIHIFGSKSDKLEATVNGTSFLILMALANVLIDTFNNASNDCNATKRGRSDMKREILWHLSNGMKG